MDGLMNLRKSMAWNNTYGKHILAEFRDAMLPKLMRGEVRVGEGFGKV